MRFHPLPVPGAYRIELELRADERGSFARMFCQEEFGAHGLPVQFVQCNVARTAKPGTLRGLHYQLAPFSEGKLIRCGRGRIYDVLVDLRQDSPAYCSWYGLELAAGEPFLAYAPPGTAHGYQTLSPDTEVFYMTTAMYSPAHERGIRWDDPLFQIKWPAATPILSAKDRSYLDYTPRRAPGGSTTVQA